MLRDRGFLTYFAASAFIAKECCFDEIVSISWEEIWIGTIVLKIRMLYPVIIYNIVSFIARIRAEAIFRIKPNNVVK